MKYDQMSVFESIVAKQHVRIEIDVPGEGGRGWRRSASSIELDSQQDLGEAWRRDLQAGTAYMLQETLVKANDAHMDAKAVRETAKHGTVPVGHGHWVICVQPTPRFGHACIPTALVRYTQNRAAAACRGTSATVLLTSSRSSGGATLSQTSAAPMLPLNPAPPLSQTTARLLENKGTICGHSGSWISGWQNDPSPTHLRLLSSLNISGERGWGSGGAFSLSSGSVYQESALLLSQEAKTTWRPTASAAAKLQQ